MLRIPISYLFVATALCFIQMCVSSVRDLSYWLDLTPALPLRQGCHPIIRESIHKYYFKTSFWVPKQLILNERFVFSSLRPNDRRVYAGVKDLTRQVFTTTNAYPTWFSARICFLADMQIDVIKIYMKRSFQYRERVKISRSVLLLLGVVRGGFWFLSGSRLRLRMRNGASQDADISRLRHTRVLER